MYIINLANTAKYKTGKVYPCRFCNKVKFVMMETETGSVLPVECDENGNPPEEEIFDPKIHRSHLLYCTNKEERAKSWKLIVDEMKEQFKVNRKKHFKELLK